MNMIDYPTHITVNNEHNSCPKMIVDRYFSRWRRKFMILISNIFLTGYSV
jgi:hypothetical protein